MPERIETLVYRIDELDDDAKTVAREWYRQDGPVDGWYETVFDDFQIVCNCLGIDIKTRTVRLAGGGSRQAPCIYFSGFWSQGDGACFEGTYAYRCGATAAVRKHAPKDRELDRIASDLQKCQRRNFYALWAVATHRGRYSHEYGMSIEVKRGGPFGYEATSDAESCVTEAMRDLARWLYRQLEAEYSFQQSDALVDEAICANDYTFTADGRRFR